MSSTAPLEFDFVESLSFAIEAIVHPMHEFLSGASRRARHTAELKQATTELTLEIISAKTEEEYAVAAREALKSAHRIGELFRKAHQSRPKRTSARELQIDRSIVLMIPVLVVAETIEYSAHARPLVLSEIEYKTFRQVMESPPPPPSDVLKKAWARYAK